MKKIKIFLLLGMVILIVAVLTELKFGWWEKYGLGKKNENEVEEIMTKISEILIVPEEIPSVATVTDKELLADQAFFNKAEDGDKLLIFANANLAILYRPSIEKIVEISQISAVNNPQIISAPTEEKTGEIKIKIALYNGNGQAGIASRLEADIINKIEDFEVVEKRDAVNNYDKSQIVNISGNYGEVAMSLAQQLGGEVVQMPEGENKPDADLLIIVGKNWP